MVQSCTIDSVLSWLGTRGNYRIFQAAIEKLRQQLESTPVERICVLAPSDDALTSAGVASNGTAWATLAPNEVLLYLLKVDACWPWPAVPPALYTFSSLAEDLLALHICPLGVSVPLLGDVTLPQLLKVKCLPCGSFFVFLEFPVPPPAGCPCSALYTPTLEYTTLSASWQPTLPSLADVLRGNEAVSLFADWILESLDAAFSQPGIYTILAPNNAAVIAFASALGGTSPSRALSQLSPSDFVILGLAPPSRDPPFAYEVRSASGRSIVVTSKGGVARYNQATAPTTSGVTAANGILFVLDDVLLWGLGRPSMT